MNNNSVNIPNVDIGNSKKLIFEIGINGDLTFTITNPDKNGVITTEDIIKAVATTQLVNMSTFINNDLKKIDDTPIEELNDEMIKEFAFNSTLNQIYSYESIINEIKTSSLYNYVMNKILSLEKEMKQNTYQYKYLTILKQTLFEDKEQIENN